MFPNSCSISEEQLRFNIHKIEILFEKIIADSLFFNKNIDYSKSEIIESFFSSIPKIKETVITDIQAAFDGDPAAKSTEEIILAYPCIEAITVQRFAHLLYHLNIPILPRMMTEWVHSRTGIDIHPGATIGTHFFIDHGTGVVIGETCHIGNNVKLYHAVTLGARSFQKDDQGKLIKGKKRHPNVENNVVIYPYATILGGETLIGEGSTIGANVFLTHSISKFSLVYLEDGMLRILAKNNHIPSKNVKI